MNILLALSLDLSLALLVVISVLIYTWAKGKIPDNRIAIIFTAAIVFFVFIKNPTMIWVVTLIYLYSSYGKEIFKG